MQIDIHISTIPIEPKILRKYKIKTPHDKEEKFSHIYFVQIEKIPHLMQVIYKY